MMKHFTNKSAYLFIAFSFLLFATAKAQTNVQPTTKAIELIKKNIAATGLNLSLLNTYKVSDAYEDKKTNTFFVYLQQTYQDIPVYNKISVFVFKHDTLVQARLDRVDKLPATENSRATSYSITPTQAIIAAANHLSIYVTQEPQLLRKNEVKKHFVYAVKGLAADSTTSDLVWVPINDGKEVKLGWNVRIASPNGIDDWFVRVDAQTGEYIEKNSLVVFERAATVETVDPSCVNVPSSVLTKSADISELQTTIAPPTVSSGSYRVFPLPVESANFGSRTIETDPWLKAGSSNNAVSLGWHSDNVNNYSTTRGNNVWAQEDIAGTNATTGFTDNSTTSIPILTFDQPLNDATLQPLETGNMRSAIDNLFYWNNLMHDISYQYGFNEAAGNFQANNQARGGLGNDYVHAFAEDGAGLNNANFATPADGQNPVMRMYQWNVGTTTSFTVSAPSAVAGSYVAVESGMDLNNQMAYTGPKTGNIVLVAESAGTHLACGTITNAAALNGNIALIDRGTCNFAVKIKAAQNAGAIGVIVINNAAGASFSMTGTDFSINIPAVMISLADGNTLKANLTGLAGTMSSAGILRDGSLDNGVISHEYTHGISSRLTGGPTASGCLVNAEQMGEGWSDYMALMVTTNWATAVASDGVKSRTIATYASAQAATGAGLRTYPYSTNMSTDPWTYGMLATNTAGEVHTIGEIWCSTIWDMTWNIIQTEGIDADIYHGTKGNNIALQLVIQAMKYQPCSPGFLDGRDAILKADSVLYNYAHKCAIWNAFARRGMGKSASQGSSNSYTDQVAATDLPNRLGISQTANTSSFASGDNITYTIKAQCDCAPLSNISITDTLSSRLSYVSSSAGSTYTAPVVHFDGINFSAGETKTFTVQATVTGPYTAPVTLINDTQDPSGYNWTNSIFSGGTSWVVSTDKSHSTSHAWFAKDMPTTTDFRLTSDDVVLDTLSTLSFWHYFETDASYDGGVVEMSINNGNTWIDLGPYMTQNGYNSSFDPTYSVLANRPSFSGSTGGAFIQTIITLSNFAGATARFRFRFSSDVADGGDGWYIDDILLQNKKGIVNAAYAFSGASVLANYTVAGFLNAALPVNFLGFDAQKQNNSAALHWKVSNEINVGNYIVQRSTDGLSFVNIGTLPPSVIQSSEKNYYYTDNNPVAGINYYRVVETDLDNKTTISSIKSLRFDNGGLVIKLSPVPAIIGTVQLSIENTGGRTAFIAYLLNLPGQLIKTFNVKTGVNQLDLQNISKGMYYLKIQLGEGQVEVKKLLVQ